MSAFLGFYYKQTDMSHKVDNRLGPLSLVFSPSFLVGYHSDIIRSFECIIVSGTSMLLSCSNDGTIKAMSLDSGEVDKTYSITESFVFGKQEG